MVLIREQVTSICPLFFCAVYYSTKVMIYDIYFSAFNVVMESFKILLSDIPRTLACLLILTSIKHYIGPSLIKNIFRISNCSKLRSLRSCSMHGEILSGVLNRSCLLGQMSVYVKCMQLALLWRSERGRELAKNKLFKFLRDRNLPQSQIQKATTP